VGGFMMIDDSGVAMEAQGRDESMAVGNGYTYPSFSIRKPSR
jgi:hypothetical protein